MSWLPNGQETVRKYAGSIISVVKRTARDENGVFYEVLIVAEDPTYEDGDNEFLVWRRRVDFSPHVSSGGPAFVAASREQDLVADQIWSVQERVGK